MFGTNDIRNVSGVIDPQWRCYVDDLEIPSSAPYPYPENNWRMCGVDHLVDKTHTLTVRVDSQGQTFWFDYLLYSPSANAVLDGSVILVPSKDPSLIYGSEWESLEDSWTMTRIHGATMSFQFTGEHNIAFVPSEVGTTFVVGTSISWYGVYPKELPTRPALATYSIDGGTETAFALQGLPSNSSTAYFQLMFKIDVHSVGPHTLQVTFKGGPTTTPLSLGYLLVQTATTNRTIGTPTLVDSSNKTSLSIAGLVFGVVALLVVVVASLLFFYSKHRGRNGTKVEVVITPPNPPPIIDSRPRFDLASSSPSLGMGAADGHDEHRRGSRWLHNLRGSFLATLGQAPHLGIIAAATASVPDVQKTKENPETMSRWALWSLAKHQQRVQAAGGVPSRWTPVGCARERGHEQGYPPIPTSGAVGLGQALSPSTGEDSVYPSPSIVPPSVSHTDEDASYYGGYRTRREIMELEQKGRQQSALSDLS